MRLRRYPHAPAALEAGPPDLSLQTAQAALEKLLREAAEKRESGLVRAVLGCDGRPIVTAYLGPCQDVARAANGGTAALGIDLGNGARVLVATELGRSYSSSSGYQGAGLLAGGFPAATAATAPALGLDPIDDLAALTIEGHTGDHGAALMGATITGRYGIGTLTAYGITIAIDASYRHKVWYWEDSTSGDSPTEVTLSAPTGSGYGIVQIEMISPTRAVALEKGEGKLYFIENGAEVGTAYQIAEFDGTPNAWITAKALRFAIIPGTDGDEAIVQGICDWDEYPGSYPPGTNGALAVAFVRVSGLLSGVVTVEEFWKEPAFEGERYSLTMWGPAQMDETGKLWGAGPIQNYAIESSSTHIYHTGRNAIWSLSAPYSDGPQIVLESTFDPDLEDADVYAEFLSFPTVSPDNVLFLHRKFALVGNPAIVDNWVRSPDFAIIPAGAYKHTHDQGIPFWDPDGRLWIFAEKDGLFYYQLFQAPYANTSPVGELEVSWEASESAMFAGRHIAGSQNVLFLLATSTSPAGFSWIKAPWTPDSTVHEVASPHASDSLAWLTMPRIDFFDMAAGLTLEARSLGITGDLQHTIRLDYSNDSLTEDASGVRITLPVPAGTSYISSSDSGHWDPLTRTITWFIDTIAAAGSGYVTAVLRPR
jgi:hypothetical protein